MKRTLSIILCLVMVLSLVAVSAYAAPKADEVGKVASGYTPEGTGIDSLDKITDPAGKYYLTKDVTAGATLTAEFKGTLDGNGKTITVSAPIFDKLAGTVKNLVIKGAVDTSANAVQAGALAAQVTGASVITNVKNEASVKGYVTAGNGPDASESKTSGYKAGAAGLVGRAAADVEITKCANTGAINGYCAGGIVGLTDGEVKVRITSCVNTGKITNVGVTATVGDGHGSIAGIVGCLNNSVDTVIDDCVNAGEIVAVYKQATGGIVGGAWRSDKTCVAEDNKVVIKNCKNTANIEGGWQTGGIAGWMRINISIENCENSGKIVSNQSYSGGILGRGGFDNKNNVKNSDGTYSYIKVFITDCKNTGAIQSFTGQAGGIHGYCETKVEYKNCVNTGTIGLYNPDGTNTANIHGGGIAGGFQSVAEFTNCVNTGKIEVGNRAGGIFGNSSQPKENAVQGKIIINNCVNTADITSTASSAGGAGGYMWATSTHHMVVDGFVNTGKITAKTFASQFFSYTNSVSTVLQNAVGAGSVKGSQDTTHLSIHGLSSADASAYVTKNVYLVENDGTAHYSYTETEANAASIITIDKAPAGAITIVTKAQLASGEVAYKLNEAIGKEVFKQTLGTDAVPTFEGKSVLKNADGTYANPAPVTPSKPTGDMTVVIFAIMVLTVGSAVVIGKKISVR